MGSKSKNGNQHIQVFARVRPFNSSEHLSRNVVEIKSDREISVKDTKQSNTFKTFTFNNVFGPKSAQIDVYRSVVVPLIDEVLSGYNCTVFAYGQTGTGKTFTMEGERSTDAHVSWENDPLAGIVPRTLSQLFDELRLLQVDFIVKVSFLELYNEELIDLLSPTDDTSKLRLFEDSAKKGAVIISGLEEVSVHCKADVYEILERGSLKRQTAATLMNAHSSRSHTVFTVTIHIRESSSDGEEFMRTGKINLVDLAGSENIGRSGAINKRAREAGNINQSLLTLGRVITALVDHSPHIPYRESKLTRILQESLGGRTKTSIIATISPAACNLEETLSTLDYAHRAKHIQNKPEINQKICKKNILKDYASEIEMLQRDLEATRQRTGIYIDKVEYDNMILRIDLLGEDIKLKTEEMDEVHAEYEKKRAVCSELEEQQKVLDEQVAELSTYRDVQKSNLSKLKSEAKQVVIDTSVEDYLTMCHMETLQQLSSQTDTLLKSTVETTQMAELLYDKIDRARNAANRNQRSIDEFSSKNNEIIDGLKELIQVKVDCLSATSSALVSNTKENLSKMQDHFHNAVEESSELMASKQGIHSLITAVQERVKEDAEQLEVIDQSSEKFLFTLSDTKFKYTSIVQESIADVLKILAEQQSWVYETELKAEIDCESAKEVLQEWCDEIPAQLETISNALLQKVKASNQIFDSSLKNDESILQRYCGLQEECEEIIDDILKSLSKLKNKSEECQKLMDSRSKSIQEESSMLVTGIQEAAESVRTGLEREKSSIDAVMTQFDYQFDLVPQHFKENISQLHVDPQLLSMDQVHQFGEEIKGSASSFMNSVEGHFRKDTENYEQLSSLMNSTTLEAIDSITSGQQDIQHHLSQYLSTVEALKGEVQKGTGNLGDIMKSLEAPFVEKIEEYEGAIEDVQTYGAKPATPTGKTPVRSDVRIPRELAATSPHERILSRLRGKYTVMSRISHGDSDTTYSDVDSDISVCDIDILANKENSSIEKEGSEKSFQSKVPVMRKPLSQNN